jgi:hypothetical protein
MKINFILSTLIVFIVFCTSVSCNNSSSINKKEIIGKWNIVGLISKTDKITITESNLYTVEFNSNDTFIMQGEDNQLKAKFAFNNPNELQLEEITKTDVCCNSPLVIRYLMLLLKASICTTLEKIRYNLLLLINLFY